MSLLERIEGIVTKKDELIESLESQLAEKNRNAKKAGETLQSQKTYIVELETKQTNLNEKILELENSYKEVKGKLKTKTQELEQLQNLTNKIKEENVILKKDSDNATKLQSANTKKISKLEQKLMIKSQEIDELAKLIELLESQPVLKR